MSIHLTYEYSPKIPSSICLDIPILYNPPYPHIPIQSYTLKAKIPINSYQNSTVFPIHTPCFPWFSMFFPPFPVVPQPGVAPGHPFGSPKNCRPAPRCNSSAARHSRPQQAPGKWIYHNVIYHYRIIHTWYILSLETRRRLARERKRCFSSISEYGSRKK